MAVVCIAVLVGIVLMVFRYFKFVSKTVYEESVSHLTEVFHQSDNMMRELTDKNLTYLHMWGESLQDILGEDEICDYIKKAQEDTGFLEACHQGLTVQQKHARRLLQSALSKGHQGNAFKRALRDAQRNIDKFPRRDSRWPTMA